MSTKHVVTLICDPPGIHAGTVETVTVTLDGVTHEAEHCARHYSELVASFAPFIAAARKARTGKSRPTSAAARREIKDGNADVRAFAAERGIPCADKGRISSAAIAAYEAAHGTGGRS